MKEEPDNAATPENKSQRLRNHLTAHVPKLCRTFSIFSLQVWFCEPLVCAADDRTTALHYHKTIVSRYRPQCGHPALRFPYSSPLHMSGQICFVPKHFLRVPVISWTKAVRASSVDVHQTANKHTRGMLLPSHHPGPGTWYGRTARSQQKRHM